MKNIYTFLAFVIFPMFLMASPGDTTKVLVHDNVHWTWNGDKYQKGNFPDGSKTYAKIWLKYTLGCPNTGCSDWDYTTQFKLRDKINDSTYVNYELGRIITPYGGYLNKNWKHNFYFDVTDYAPLLVDSAEINARYGGWQDGFTISTEFIFIEGTPARDVLEINSLAHGSFKYGAPNDANSCENRTAPQPININANATNFKIKATPTGHGFNGNGYDPGNPDNCSEFCNKWFKVSIDGNLSNQTQIWRDDCGTNPLFRQNGTWIYNRAGWCPGDEGVIHEFDVTDEINAGTTQQIGFTWQPYSNTSPNATSYIFDGQFIQYGDFNLQNDAEIVEIGVPSLNENYSRQNPACSRPLVKIRNNGGEPLTSVDMVFGLKGFGNTVTYTWTGNLAHNQTEVVEIPTNGWLISKNFQYDVFTVELQNPNGKTDEAAWNNYMESKFERMPPTQGVYLWIKTNNFPGENSYAVFDDLGNKVHENLNLQANAQLKDTFNLPDGCYTVTIYDSDCDGLYFPFNNPPYTTNNPEGTGFAQLWKADGGQIANFEANFGCEISYGFTVGKGYSGGEPELTSVETKNELNYFSAYPNPVNNQLNVEFALANNNEPLTLEVFNLYGKLLYVKTFSSDFVQDKVDFTNYAKGIYLLKVTGQNGVLKTEKVVFE